MTLPKNIFLSKPVLLYNTVIQVGRDILLASKTIFMFQSSIHLTTVFMRVGRTTCLWIKRVFVQVGKVLNRGATADERRQGATLRRQKYITIIHDNNDHDVDVPSFQAGGGAA